MATELEFKARVDSHGPLRILLRKKKAVFGGRVMETNIHFDTPNQELLRKQSGLRIRIVRNLSSGKNLPSSITFKGPMQKGPYKLREELETTIGDENEMMRLLEALGFHEQIRFEKRRETWTLGPDKGTRKTKVELDEVPQLGSFVEIEAASAAAIRAALKMLDLEKAPAIRTSYVGMLVRTHKGPRKSARPLVFRFR